MKAEGKISLKHLLLLHLGILIYSFSAVFTKLAAESEPFSLLFFVFYTASLLLLLVCALVWQQILRFFKLTDAYINRSASMLWTVLFGILFFAETVTPKHIAGVVLIIIGIIVVVTAHE